MNYYNTRQHLANKTTYKEKILPTLNAKVEILGESCRSLEKVLGVHYTTIAKWLNGDSLPDIMNFVNLCWALDISLGELFDD